MSEELQSLTPPQGGQYDPNADAEAKSKPHWEQRLAAGALVVTLVIALAFLAYNGVLSLIYDPETDRAESPEQLRTLERFASFMREFDVDENGIVVATELRATQPPEVLETFRQLDLNHNQTLETADIAPVLAELLMHKSTQPIGATIAAPEINAIPLDLWKHLGGDEELFRFMDSTQDGYLELIDLGLE